MTTILIPLYEDVTHLDFTGPHQFLSRVPGAQVVVASLDGELIVSHGLTFTNLTALEKFDRCDVLCIPGGLGCIPAMEDERFLNAIRRIASEANYLTSVCTGSSDSRRCGRAQWPTRRLPLGVARHADRLRRNPRGWSCRAGRQRHHWWRRRGWRRFRADPHRRALGSGRGPVRAASAGICASAAVRRRPPRGGANPDPSGRPRSHEERFGRRASTPLRSLKELRRIGIVRCHDGLCSGLAPVSGDRRSPGEPGAPVRDT